MSNKEFKQKFAKGSLEKPTLEECYNNKDCYLHFLSAIKKFKPYLTRDEIYDLSIDSYLYAIKYFDGKSGFLTFLYRISWQKGYKYIQKKMLNIKCVEHKAFMHKSCHDSDKSYAISDQEYNFLKMRYVSGRTIEEISKTSGIGQKALKKIIREATEKLKNNS